MAPESGVHLVFHGMRMNSMIKGLLAKAGLLVFALAQFHDVLRLEPDGALTAICQFSVSQKTEVTSH